VTAYVSSGRVEAEHLPELHRLMEGEDRERAVTLDLREVTLVDRDAITFLAQCEEAGAALEDCRAYVGDWIARELAETKDLAAQHSQAPEFRR
jgi:hypothetical protein